MGSRITTLYPCDCEIPRCRFWLWYQLVDKGDREDNWLESSCSASFLILIAKAIKHGIVDDSYREVCDKAYTGLLEHMVESDDTSLN